ncbi:MULTISPECIES: DUF4209 domain-containing protein [unclassified Mesorhizobium]|uniref:DUF4209 domain-containing protein n=1 Tax=unclassified Mesorhizobium TaxID=325217 RepID=UPI00143F4C84|nr:MULTISPECIES: DUF4209 domain-containing protein [unclassified Mesorhizobium]
MAVPAEIETVIQALDQGGPIAAQDIENALTKARAELGEIGEEAHNSIWGEIIAWSLMTDAWSSEPWRCYFGPVGQGRNEDGSVAYIPDVTAVSGPILDGWIARVADLKHPVLRARYADLCWELARRIDGRKPSFHHALAAINSYLESVESRLTADFYHQMAQVLRAFDLALSIKNLELIVRARDMLLRLHDRAVAGEGLWWKSFDRLIGERNAELTDDHRARLVQSLEALAERYANKDDPQVFSPFQLNDITRRLVTYYRRKGSRADVHRLSETLGRAFEHAASLGNAMQSSSSLQSAENAYLDAGLADDAKRARIGRAAAIRQSQAEMQEYSFSSTITFDDMDAFLAGLVVDDPRTTFVRIADHFLWRTAELEKWVRDLAEHAPVMSMISMQIMTGDHVAAHIGGVEDDLDGRVCHQAVQDIQYRAIFLQEALTRAIEKHNLNPHHFTTWAGRTDLFDDLTFVLEGVGAWFAGDYVKAIFVLTPQVETALRKLTGNLGDAVTRKHPTMQDREVAIGMGEILGNAKVKEALGPDLLLFFKVLFSDPRGLNLRNSVAHGLLERGLVNSVVGDRLIHTLLVLGLWSDIARYRNKKEEASSIEEAPAK